MAAPPVNAHLEGRRHLLGGRAQIDRRAAEHEPLAASLVDRVVTARRIRVSLDEPAEPVVRTDLLVCDDEKDEIAGGDESLPRKRRERNGTRRDLVLHVERTAPPDLTVDEIARPRVAIPLGRIREDGVRVREESQGRPVTASNPRDEVGTVRLACVELAFDAVPQRGTRAEAPQPASRSREG